MDLQELLAYRQLIETELKAREKWLNNHGNKYYVDIPETDKEFLKSLNKSKIEEEEEELKEKEKKYIKEEENKVISQSKNLGVYYPKNKDRFISVTKSNFQPPVYNAEDLKFIQSEQGTFNRKKNWLKTYFEEQVKFDNLIKKKLK